MSCPQYPEISAYMDNMLVPAERDRFLFHLQTCQVCRHRLDELEQLQLRLRELPSPVLGFDLAARLEERMRTDAVRRSPARASWFGWSVGGLAASLSLVAGVWLGGFLIGGSAAMAPVAGVVRVFDPVPPGGLCAAAELCGLSKGMK